MAIYGKQANARGAQARQQAILILAPHLSATYLSTAQAALLACTSEMRIPAVCGGLAHCKEITRVPGSKLSSASIGPTEAREMG